MTSRSMKTSQKEKKNHRKKKQEKGTERKSHTNTKSQKEKITERKATERKVTERRSHRRRKNTERKSHRMKKVTERSHRKKKIRASCRKKRRKSHRRRNHRKSQRKTESQKETLFPARTQEKTFQYSIRVHSIYMFSAAMVQSPSILQSFTNFLAQSKACRAGRSGCVQPCCTGAALALAYVNTCFRSNPTRLEAPQHHQHQNKVRKLP